MINSLYNLARRLRNLPGLRSCSSFWHLVHRPYYALMRVTGASVNYQLTPDFSFQIPAYFLRQEWRTYEPDGTEAFIAWFREPTEKPRALLDIGTSVGFYSAVAFAADPKAQIYAFDADLESLRLVPLFCSNTPHRNQLHLIWGFLASDTEKSCAMPEAEAATMEQVKKITPSPRLERIAYQSLVNKEKLPATPVYTVDTLTGNGAMFEGHKLLFKCDVEGGELHVLRGSKNLLQRVRPSLMISVHPAAWLAQNNTTVAQIEDFLREAGYTWTVFSTDHEDHWIAKPQGS